MNIFHLKRIRTTPPAVGGERDSWIFLAPVDSQNIGYEESDFGTDALSNLE